MTTIPEVPSTYEDNAHAIRLDLQRLVQGIRGFRLLTTEGRRRAAITGHVDDDFLRSMGCFSTRIRTSSTRAASRARSFAIISAS